MLCSGCFPHCPASKLYCWELPFPEEARQGPEEVTDSGTMSLQEFTSAQHSLQEAFPAIPPQQRGAEEIGTGEVFGK